MAKKAAKKSSPKKTATKATADAQVDTTTQQPQYTAEVLPANTALTPVIVDEQHGYETKVQLAVTSDAVTKIPVQQAESIIMANIDAGRRVVANAEDSLRTALSRVVRAADDLVKSFESDTHAKFTLAFAAAGKECHREAVFDNLDRELTVEALAQLSPASYAIDVDVNVAIFSAQAKSGYYSTAPKKVDEVNYSKRFTLNNTNLPDLASAITAAKHLQDSLAQLAAWRAKLSMLPALERQFAAACALSALNQTDHGRGLVAQVTPIVQRFLGNLDTFTNEAPLALPLLK